MSRWPLVPLTELASLVTGSTPSSTDAEAFGGDVPFVTPGDLDGNQPLTRAERHLTKAAAARMRLVPPGSILVSCIGNLGKLAISGCSVVSNQQINAVVFDANLIEPLYGFYACSNLRGVLEQLATTSLIPIVNKSKFGTLKIPVPPVAEQRRIVAEIEARRAQVRRIEASLRQQLMDLERCRKLAVESAFGIDGPPATFGKVTLPGFKPLAEVSRLETGHTPSRKRPDWWGGEIRWLALPDIRAVDGKRVYETCERTNAEGLANSSARLLPSDSVAFSRTASVGFVTILGREMAVSQDFAVWLCGPELRPDYLMHALRTSREHLLTASSGAIHKTIYMDDLKSFQVFLPPIDVQERIVATVDATTTQTEWLIQAIRRQLQDVSALDQAVLREAFE